jgi:ribosomal protein S18 acetylase RimI-like enzyme
MPTAASTRSRATCSAHATSCTSACSGNESAILVAELDGRIAGFTQLYPMFSSVRTARIWILNDLFVDADARRRGVANALLAGAARFAREQGAAGLMLETMRDNTAARALYVPPAGTRTKPSGTACALPA